MRAVPTGHRGLGEAGGPLVRAALAGVVGAAVLVLLGGVLASTAGLLFACGIMGAVIGLALSRAAVPSPTAGDDRAPMPRRTVARLAMLVATLAVALGAVGTWVVALLEGGALGLIDYLWTTFGLLIPAELVVAALAAAWGARAGPVTRG